MKKFTAADVIKMISQGADRDRLLRELSLDDERLERLLSKLKQAGRITESEMATLAPRFEDTVIIHEVPLDNVVSDAGRKTKLTAHSPVEIGTPDPPKKAADDFDDIVVELDDDMDFPIEIEEDEVPDITLTNNEVELTDLEMDAAPPSTPAAAASNRPPAPPQAWRVQDYEPTQALDAPTFEELAAPAPSHASSGAFRQIRPETAPAAPVVAPERSESEAPPHVDTARRKPEGPLGSITSLSARELFEAAGAPVDEAAGKGRSFSSRIMLALTLMAAFYVTALGLVAALIAIPVAMFMYGVNVGKVWAFCVVGALAILWSILPRFDKFQAPGPKLSPEDQPGLFREIARIAENAGQKVPTEIYVVNEVNAWVAERGGLMGLGARRVMALGLPLLQRLTVSELRAVVAHEFGHFHGGDTKLGPWVYSTRAALFRTLENLSKTSRLLQLPFVLFAKVFLRLTHTVSRHQEYTADDLAARITGAGALATGLVKVHAAIHGYDRYWAENINPAVRKGRIPPILSGFDMFMNSEKVVETLNQALYEEWFKPEDDEDQYRTHPSLSARISALKSFPMGSDASGEPRSMELINSPGELEKGAVAASQAGAGELVSVTWDQMGRVVFIPTCHDVLASTEPIRNVAPEDLPGVLAQLKESHTRTRAEVLSSLGISPESSPATTEELNGYTAGVVQCVIATALDARGWSPVLRPGYPTLMTKGDHGIDIAQKAEDLVTGRLTAPEWFDWCRAIGIAAAHPGA